MQMAVLMPPRPLYMAVAPTMEEGVGAEDTATALDMVHTFEFNRTVHPESTVFTSTRALRFFHIFYV